MRVWPETSVKSAGSVGGSSVIGIAGTGGRAFLDEASGFFFVDGRLLFFREVDAVGADASGMKGEPQGVLVRLDGGCCQGTSIPRL